MTRLTDRSANEIVVLALTTTVCFVVGVEAVVISVVAVVHPNANTTASLHILFDIVGVMLGAVVGYGAGVVSTGATKPPDEQKPAEGS